MSSLLPLFRFADEVALQFDEEITRTIRADHPIDNFFPGSAMKLRASGPSALPVRQISGEFHEIFHRGSLFLATRSVRRRDRLSGDPPKTANGPFTF